MSTQHGSIENDSVWFGAVEKLKVGSRLLGSASVDVCIVGAGIAGVSCAYHLAKAGKRVAVIDMGSVGGGQTCMTTAHLANAVDDRYMEIERIHGSEGARIVADSHTAAIRDIAKIATEENIACEFEYLDGYLLPADDGDPKELDDELEAAHRAGLKQVTRLEQWPVFAPGASRGAPCLKFPEQAQFHPLKYITGLAEVCERKYGVVFYAGRVNNVKGGPAAMIETADGGRIHADAIVVATNSPVNDRFVMHTKQGPYTSYVLGIEIAADAIPTALYWDTEDPYHYVRLEKGRESGADLLIVGGEDHKAGQADDGESRFLRLDAWARSHFPSLGQVRFKWCGQVMEPVDGVAFIGRNPLDDDNVYIVTGDSGMGMTHGAMSGLIITDLILGRPNPWAKLYDPARKTLNSLWEFAKENANVALQYTDWFQPSEVESTADIQPGSGAIIRNGMQLIAAYRDEHGSLHECSAVCPHLGGIVQWNGTASSWDCPCHGSRFDAEGRVIEGPAMSNLEPVAPPVTK